MLREFYARSAPTFVIIAFVTIAGIYEFVHLPIALYPQTSKPAIVLAINSQGTNAEEFFKRYGEEIESTMGQVKDVENIIGRYRNGYARYEISFEWGVDQDEAETNIRNGLGRFASEFPDHWSAHVYYSGQHSSTIYASIRNDGNQHFDLFDIAENNVIPRLRAIPGMESAWVRRPRTDRIAIQLLPEQLLQHRLTSMDVRRRLKEHEYDRTLGTIRIPGIDSVQVAAVREPNSIEELRSLVIGAQRGRPIRLREVADVTFDSLPQDVQFTANSKELTMLGGSVAPDANIRDVSEAFVSTLTHELAQIDPNLHAEILLNPAEFINSAVSNVLWAVVSGMLIATLVVFLFLKSWSSTFVVCISIPLSLIGGFVLMDSLDIEVNLISLGAMALAVGMVVDGAIVILENIVRHFDMRQPKTIHEKVHAVWEAVIEVRRALLASLITTIIVFAPLPFTSPLASAILGDLAIVMVCVLVVSIGVTLVLIPPLVIAFTNHNSHAATSNPRWFTISEELYRKTLIWGLQGRARCLWFFGFVGLCLIAAIVVLWLFVPRTIMGEAQSSLVMWRIEIQDDQMSLEDRVKIVSQYERLVQERYKDRITKTMSETKADDRSTIWIFIKNRHDYEVLREDLNGTFRDTALVHFRAANWAPTKLEIPSPPDIKVIVTSRTEEERRRYLAAIKDVAQETGIFYRVISRPNDRQDNFVQVDLNTEKLSHLGASTQLKLPTYDDVYNAIESSLREETLYSIQIGDKDLPVVMGFPEPFTRSLNHLGNLLMNYGDRIVPLRALASIVSTNDWSEYYTEDATPVAFIEAWIDAEFPGDREEAEKALKAAFAQDPDIDEDKLQFVDTMTEVNENINSLGFALVLALMLICVVVTVQFGTFKQTALIMIAIPLGFIGVAFSLFAFQSELSVNSMLGLILLCGTAVNNSIIYIDFFNEQRSQNLPLRDTLLATARLRFRPIMLTTLTTILGMLPIALGLGSGGEILQPLGIAVCGGLWVSTVLTLIAVPYGIWLVEANR